MGLMRPCRMLTWRTVASALFCPVIMLASVACTADDATVDPAASEAPLALPAAATPVVSRSTVTSARTVTVTPTLTPTPTREPVDVLVYWAWIVPNPTGLAYRLGVGGVEAGSAAPARTALDALLTGPNADESEIGMLTSIPAGTRLLDLNIADGRATIDLSSEFEATTGTLSELMAAAQVVFTLTQFSTVDTVFFRIDGVDREYIGSHGLEVRDGLDRDSFAGSVRPMFTVERPHPGRTVSNSFVIEGESNTFEANVQWELVDRDGRIVAIDATTATAGNGDWGRYTVEVDVPDGLTGTGAVRVFDTSAKDGARIGEVEYPVVFGGQ